MPKRILIVDDEENIREMTRLALETVGYEVAEAESGLEAFAIIGANDSWDAVLLDQKMPGMVGTEVLRRLRILLPQTPVIMMTAFASIDLAVEAMKWGASDFVRKPMTPEILRNAVSAALAKTSDNQANLVESDSLQNRPRLTLNGFSVLRANVGGLARQTNERAFIVRKPNGHEQDVVVEITPEAIAAVERVLTATSLGKGFWTEQAEQYLIDFLWNDGSAPATGRLVLRRVDREALEKASRKEVGK